jgi:hypothetical protein
MKYGCFNRPPLGTRPMPMQDGWYIDGVTRTPRLVPLPFRMRPECVYSQDKADQKCTGCKWRAAA